MKMCWVRIELFLYWQNIIVRVNQICWYIVNILFKQIFKRRRFPFKPIVPTRAYSHPHIFIWKMCFMLQIIGLFKYIFPMQTMLPEGFPFSRFNILMHYYLTQLISFTIDDFLCFSNMEGSYWGNIQHVSI